MKVAVLFARSDSIYKAMQGADVYDIERDARNYAGSLPVVAHPPCRAWGRLRAFAKPRPDEKALALFAIGEVRRCGGVLEHPASSSLWAAAGLPRPGEGRDEFGGWTLPVHQRWWGHQAEKATWLYVCGVDPKDVPDMPLDLSYPTHVIGSSRRRHGGRLRGTSKKAREATPERFAYWLVQLAERAACN